MIPKGIKIDDSNKHRITIQTEKRALVFGDYFGLFFVFVGFFLLMLGYFTENFNDNKSIVLIILGMLIIILISIILTFYEYTTIIITENSLEIFKRTIIFSQKKTLERDFIEKIDWKVITTPKANLILNFRLFFGFANFKLPRVVYKNEEIFIFQNYNKEIRMWIIYYLSDLIIK